MKFIVLSENQLKAPNGYMDIRENHLLISITNMGQSVDIPNTHYCKELLKIQFSDSEDINEESFNKNIAKTIINFVNNHAHEADAIIVHCDNGISRSCAVASALSKIMNHDDNEIFCLGVPNMLVYLTILDVYFEANNKDLWTSIFYIRDKAMKAYLDPMKYGFWKHKLDK